MDISTNQLYRFDFVTDPDDPTIVNPLNQIISLTENNDKIIITETNHDRGLVRYTIDVIQKDNTFELINKIDQLIGEVSYIPVTISVDKNLFDKYDNIGPVITGAEEIIKVITENLINIKVKNVENVTFNDIITFTPITKENMAVYENPSYLTEYYKLLDFTYVGGYQVLSENPVVRYVLSELYKNKQYVPKDLGIIYVNNVALIPVGKNNDEVDYYMNIKNRISTIVNTRLRQGYFPYPIGIHNIEDIQIILELASLWNTEVVYKQTDMLVLKSNFEFGTSSFMWFKDNIDLVKRGHFPTITLYGMWQFELGGEYNRIHGKQWYSSILHYAGLLAYRKLGEEDKFIKPFTHTLKVNNDYSISLSIPTHKHVITFREYFKDILNGFQGLEYNGKESWYAEPCKDLLEGVIKRYYIQSIDPRSIPMIIPQTYEDGTTDQILLFRSPALTIYSPNSPLDFKNVDMNQAKINLIDDLKKYYRKCHGQIESVSLNDIHNMDLAELINLVEVKEGSNTYCLSKDTILDLMHPINPVTQRHFSETIVIKALLLEWGLRGLFDIGPIKGLYEDIPKRELIKPTNGELIINKLCNSPMFEEVIGNVYSVEIVFDDEKSYQIFEIATSDDTELKLLSIELWKKGYFFNYWTSALQKYSNITSYDVSTVNTLLLHASDSKADGIRAMNMLRESIINI